jgi:hypothetical protein
MRRILLPCALLLATAPLAAQPTIQLGQTVSGEITLADATQKGEGRFDVWRFQAQAGHLYLVTLRSTEFDASVAVGRRVAVSCNDCYMDDDGGGGTDAALIYNPREDGVYEIRAGALESGQRGAYRLTLQDDGLVSDTAMGDPPAIRAGETVQGRLERGDDREGGSTLVDTYIFDGHEGEEIVVTVRSADFDTKVVVGRPDHRSCTPLDNDDDGGGGTDSQLRLTLTRDGPHHVHVRGAGAGRGAYTLTVTHP